MTSLFNRGGGLAPARRRLLQGCAAAALGLGLLGAAIGQDVVEETPADTVPLIEASEVMLQPSPDLVEHDYLGECQIEGDTLYYISVQGLLKINLTSGTTTLDRNMSDALLFSRQIGGKLIVARGRYFFGCRNRVYMVDKSGHVLQRYTNKQGAVEYFSVLDNDYILAANESGYSLMDDKGKTVGVHTLAEEYYLYDMLPGQNNLFHFQEVKVAEYRATEGGTIKIDSLEVPKGIQGQYGALLDDKHFIAINHSRDSIFINDRQAKNHLATVDLSRYNLSENSAELYDVGEMPTSMRLLRGEGQYYVAFIYKKKLKIARFSLQPDQNI